VLVTWTNIHFTGHHLKHTKPTFNIISGEVIIGIPQTELLAATSLPFFFFSDSSKNQYCNLVGGLNHLEKYEFVNGKDDIPYSIMENKSHV
jgi:hypothetical protein